MLGPARRHGFPVLAKSLPRPLPPFKAFSTSAPFETLKPPPHFKKNMMLLIRRYLPLNL
jgi:hypothetical protein